MYTYSKPALFLFRIRVFRPHDFVILLLLSEFISTIFSDAAPSVLIILKI